MVSLNIVRRSYLITTPESLNIHSYLLTYLHNHPLAHSGLSFFLAVRSFPATFPPSIGWPLFVIIYHLYFLQFARLIYIYGMPRSKVPGTCL